MATERSRRSARMDMPMDRSRSLRPSVDSERFGAMSESVARHIGSWAFIAWMTIVIILWVILYPFVTSSKGRNVEAAASTTI